MNSLESRRRRCSEQTRLLQLEVIELLLPVHLDDERDDENEEGGSGDPSSLAGAAEELLGDEGSVAGGLLAALNNGGMRNPRKDTYFVAAIGDGGSLLALIRHVGVCVREFIV